MTRGICYATVAMATDYDCWHKDEEGVTNDRVMEVIKKNGLQVQKIVQEAVLTISVIMPGGHRTCGCEDAVNHAVLTAPEAITSATWERLDLILPNHLRLPKGG